MLRTGTRERLQTWVEHFSEILNRDDPTNPVKEVGVKAKQRVLRAEKPERLQRWVEHFSEILNRDDPTNTVKEDKIVESEEIEEIDLRRSR